MYILLYTGSSRHKFIKLMDKNDKYLSESISDAVKFKTIEDALEFINKDVIDLASKYYHETYSKMLSDGVLKIFPEKEYLIRQIIE